MDDRDHGLAGSSGRAPGYLAAQHPGGVAGDHQWCNYAFPFGVRHCRREQLLRDEADHAVRHPDTGLPRKMAQQAMVHSVRRGTGPYNEPLQGILYGCFIDDPSRMDAVCPRSCAPVAVLPGDLRVVAGVGEADQQEESYLIYPTPPPSPPLLAGEGTEEGIMGLYLCVQFSFSALEQFPSCIPGSKDKENGEAAIDGDAPGSIVFCHTVTSLGWWRRRRILCHCHLRQCHKAADGERIVTE